MDSVCKNCDRDLAPEFDFCPGCGQKANLHRLGWHEIAHDFIHYFTHADKGIFQLIRDLATKNGRVAYEFVNGKRRKYFPPLNFFLIIAAIFVISASWKQVDGPVDVMKAYPQLQKIKDPARLAREVPMYERSIEVRRFSKKYSNVMAMAALPISAFVYFLFYARGRYNYVEHLVGGMYLLGICILVYALVIMPVSYLLNLNEMYGVGAFFLLQIVYSSIFYVRFMGKTGAKAYVVSVLATMTGLIVWSIFSVGVFQIYIRSAFWGLFA